MNSVPPEDGYGISGNEVYRDRGQDVLMIALSGMWKQGEQGCRKAASIQQVIEHPEFAEVSALLGFVLVHSKQASQVTASAECHASARPSR